MSVIGLNLGTNQGLLGEGPSPSPLLSPVQHHPRFPSAVSGFHTEAFGPFELIFINVGRYDSFILLHVGIQFPKLQLKKLSLMFLESLSNIRWPLVVTCTSVCILVVVVIVVVLVYKSVPGSALGVFIAVALVDFYGPGRGYVSYQGKEATHSSIQR